MKALASLSTVLVTWLIATLPAAAFDHRHPALDELLTAHVSNGEVDYSALAKERAKLDAYLKETGAIEKSTFDGWNQPQQLAFLINVYNAETLQLILDHYPVSSIKKIGGLLKSPWDLKEVALFGEVTTLNHLEHEIMRKEYPEPRIHFAIVCAAKGCPPLRPEAFVPDRLEEQLEEQAQIFLSQSDKNRFDGKRLYLSPIFKWFEEDFTRGSRTLQDYVDPWFKEDVRKASVKYTDYDWDLNDK